MSYGLGDLGVAIKEGKTVTATNPMDFANALIQWAGWSIGAASDKAEAAKKGASLGYAGNFSASYTDDKTGLKFVLKRPPKPTSKPPDGQEWKFDPDGFLWSLGPKGKGLFGSIASAVGSVAGAVYDVGKVALPVAAIALPVIAPAAAAVGIGTGVVKGLTKAGDVAGNVVGTVQAGSQVFAPSASVIPAQGTIPVDQPIATAPVRPVGASATGWGIPAWVWPVGGVLALFLALDRPRGRR